MSFHEIVQILCEEIEELQDYDCSCDLNDILTDILNYTEYLRDETFVCSDCGRILSDERAYVSEYNGETYCHCCYGINKPDPISAYHETKGSLDFLDLEELSPEYYRGLEVELETDINNGVLEVLRNADPSLFRFEEDGSLEEGFEIITAPMSRIFWTHVGYNKLERLITDLKNVSNPLAWDTGRCGLHIHFNRVEVSTEAQKILKRFMVENHNFIAQISGRDEFGYCKKPIFEDYEIDCSGELYNYSRYLTLNFTPQTIEFRFWRGTLKTENIKHSVQLTEDLIRFAEFISKQDIEPSESGFIKYITANHPELNDFKNQRRARWARHYGGQK